MSSLPSKDALFEAIAVMGKAFDPAKPEDYLASFKIRKAS